MLCVPGLTLVRYSSIYHSTKGVWDRLFFDPRLGGKLTVTPCLAPSLLLFLAAAESTRFQGCGQFVRPAQGHRVSC